MLRAPSALRPCARGALAAVALALAIPAEATRPLSTDDAATLGAGGRQLELGVGLSNDRAAAGVAAREERREAGAALTFGVAPDLDLVLLAAAATFRVREGDAVVDAGSGPADVAVELKWRALGGEALALAVKPGLSLSTGGPGHGLSLALAASGTAGPLSLDVSGRYERRAHARAEDRAGRLAASLAMRVRVDRSLQLAAEIGGATSAERSTSVPAVFALAAAVASPTAAVDVDLGARIGMTAPEVDLAWLTGVTWRF